MTIQTTPRNQLMRLLARVLCQRGKNSDDDTPSIHEALYGDNALITRVRELRALEIELANSAAR